MSDAIYILGPLAGDLINFIDDKALVDKEA